MVAALVNGPTAPPRHGANGDGDGSTRRSVAVMGNSIAPFWMLLRAMRLDLQKH